MAGFTRGDEPDMTVDELLENGEDDEYSLTEEELAEWEDEIDEMAKSAMVISALTNISRLFIGGQITAAEMAERMEDHLEWAEENDVALP